MKYYKYSSLYALDSMYLCTVLDWENTMSTILLPRQYRVEQKPWPVVNLISIHSLRVPPIIVSRVVLHHS